MLKEKKNKKKFDIFGGNKKIPYKRFERKQCISCKIFHNVDDIDFPSKKCFDCLVEKDFKYE